MTPPSSSVSSLDEVSPIMETSRRHSISSTPFIVHHATQVRHSSESKSKMANQRGEGLFCLTLLASGRCARRPPSTASHTAPPRGSSLAVARGINSNSSAHCATGRLAAVRSVMTLALLTTRLRACTAGTPAGVGFIEAAAAACCGGLSRRRWRTWGRGSVSRLRACRRWQRRVGR